MKYAAASFGAPSVLCSWMLNAPPLALDKLRRQKCVLKNQQTLAVFTSLLRSLDQISWEAGIRKVKTRR